MRRNTEGYITVYLALILGIMISFISTILIGARNQTIRFRTECAMDLGLNSIFAEYHRELLKQYGLLFIDSSYGRNVSKASADAAVGQHLLHYMNLNLDDKNSPVKRDLTATHADNAVLEGIAYATDGRGEVLGYQIMRYMKVKYGLSYLPVSRYDETYEDSIFNDYESYHSRRGAESDRVDAIIDEYNSTLPEDEEPYSISNPADAVEDISGSNVLYYAMGERGDTVFRRIDTDSLISHRGYTEGAGLKSHQESPFGAAYKPLLIDYIYDRCGYYKKEKEGSALAYEVEYIIEGKGSDMENMEGIADRIFRIRYAVNMSYLLSSSSKQAEAEAMAIAATSAIGLPELAEAVKYTILFAWGYAESAKDLRILYDGHGLKAVKDDATWNTPLEQMVDFKGHLNEYAAPGGELDYKMFLNIFLMACDRDKLNLRLMDIMEADIRKTPGNGAFMMDRQIYQLTADVNVSSAYGYGCSIKRYYSYE